MKRKGGKRKGEKEKDRKPSNECFKDVLGMFRSKEVFERERRRGGKE